MMEELLNDRNIVVNFDEQIVFDQLEQNKNAIWSLMLASGYLKIQEIEYRGMLLTPFSSFDVGKHPSGKTQPERFYHGFVLGLLVDLKERYEVKSNRESDMDMKKFLNGYFNSS